MLRAYTVMGPFELPVIDANSVLVAFRRAAPTAAGADNWAPPELQHLPRRAAIHLAQFYRA
eukprot:6579890-Alexandrium_andersonii.AAC.1